jgi:hypothetical protein
MIAGEVMQMIDGVVRHKLSQLSNSFPPEREKTLWTETMTRYE